jgi:hypothetical protein
MQRNDMKFFTQGPSDIYCHLGPSVSVPVIHIPCCYHLCLALFVVLLFPHCLLVPMVIQTL